MRILQVFPASLLALATTGCEPLFNAPLFGPPEAKVRVVNAASPALDVIQHGELLASVIHYSANSGCFTADNEDHGLAMRYTSAVLPLVGPLVTGGPFRANQVMIVATTHAGPSGSIVRFIQVVPDFSTTEQQTGVHVVNASGSGPLDVYISAPDAPLGTPTVAQLDNGEASTFHEIAPGLQRVRVTAAGQQDVIIDAGSRTFTAGEKVAFVISPPASGSTSLRSFFTRLFDC